MDVLAVPLRSHLTAVHHEDLATQFSRVDVGGHAAVDDLAALSAEYSRHWVGRNEWLQRGMERILGYGYGDSDDTVAEVDLLSMPYYQHFLRRLDVRHGLGVCVWHGGAQQVAIATFNRSRAEGPFGREASRFIAALRPHLYNAYAIYRRTTMLGEANRSLRATLDRAPVSVMVMDPSCRIVEANAEAERRLLAEHGLRRTTDARLQVEPAAQHRKFEEAVAQLVAGTVQNRILVITRPGRQAAEGVVLHLCALPGTNRLPSSARVIVFACPLTGECSRKVAALILQTALSLTAAESRLVLALHDAHDVAGAASLLGVGVSTARTHLKHAFDKTGARKQSELMALVERLLVAAPRDVAAPDVSQAVRTQAW